MWSTSLFDRNLELLRSLPVSRLLIDQTPYTQSVLANRILYECPFSCCSVQPVSHQENVPSFRLPGLDEGSVEWRHLPNCKNKMWAFWLRKVIGIDPDLVLDEGNEFVVADRIEKNRWLTLGRACSDKRGTEEIAPGFPHVDLPTARSELKTMLILSQQPRRGTIIATLADHAEIRGKEWCAT